MLQTVDDHLGLFALHGVRCGNFREVRTQQGPLLHEEDERLLVSNHLSHVRGYDRNVAVVSSGTEVFQEELQNPETVLVIEPKVGAGFLLAGRSINANHDVPQVEGSDPFVVRSSGRSPEYSQP